MLESSAWINPLSLSWIDPLAGALCTIWGGSIGILGYFWVRRGRARVWVFGHLFLGLIIAILSCCGGVAALLMHQPQPIYISLLGMGIPLLVAALFSIFNVGNVYRLVELRRMQALDQ